ncbi:MAG: 50S ribosomal protein L15 [Deltaproteobacteria bacterium]|nr:50S ribosomal protein L15 [Deltaproteobacteria bacterium]
MGLDTLTPPEGANHRRKRVGRGHGSGLGKTAGRGHKGQKARTGGQTTRGFEGGQMPLQRRLPKRGFKNRNRKEIASVNLKDLERFPAGAVVDVEALRGAGLIGKRDVLVKMLGEGELDRALTIRTHRISESARQKVVAAGGAVELVELV